MSQANADDHTAPALDPTSFGLLIKDIHHLTVRRADPLVMKLGLTIAQFNLLKAISKEPGITGADLAVVTLATPQAVAQLSARIEDGGYIRREQLRGRSIGHYLTESGSKVLAQAHDVMRGVHRGTLSVLTEREQADLVEMLGRLRAKLIQDLP
jgi:DNA-binding MarR family transcriptional regulator